MSNLLELKAALRAQVKSRLADLSEKQRQGRSLQALALLQQQPIWHKAQTVLLYAPLKDELNVWPLLATALAERKAVALPRFDAPSGQYIPCAIKEVGKDLESGRYGIQEPGNHCQPLDLKRLDFVLVPGVAFDLHGRRIGRGKGYYDRLLAGVRGHTCGIAFDEQIVTEVPVGPHDSDVNCILTPTRWIEL